MVTIGTPVLWLSFGVLSIIIMIIDVFMQEIYKYTDNSTKLAFILSLMWIIAAIVFGFILWLYILFTVDSHTANINFLMYMSGYLIEKSLSVDNIAIWFFLFQSFSVPIICQRVVLFYGSIVALILRCIIIFFGVLLLSKWSCILYCFSFILFFTGIQIILSNRDQENNNFLNLFLINWLYKNLRLTKHFYKNKFFLKKRGVIFATPLFLVLVLIELNDIIFSIDSIPAIFSITKDPFIIITSNFFSIIGLRSIYVIISKTIQNLHFIKYGIGCILIFISMKTLLKEFIPISMLLSFLFILSIFLFFFILEKSYIKKNKKINK